MSMSNSIADLALADRRANSLPTARGLENQAFSGSQEDLQVMGAK
jgi:hypothetical protein